MVASSAPGRPGGHVDHLRGLQLSSGASRATRWPRWWPAQLQLDPGHVDHLRGLWQLQGRCGGPLAAPGPPGRPGGRGGGQLSSSSIPATSITSGASGSSRGAVGGLWQLRGLQGDQVAEVVASSAPARSRPRRSPPGPLAAPGPPARSGAPWWPRWWPAQLQGDQVATSITSGASGAAVGRSRASMATRWPRRSPPGPPGRLWGALGPRWRPGGHVAAPAAPRRCGRWLSVRR